MKQDRFLLGILIFIGVLVVVALLIYFIRDASQTYQPDDTPEHILQNFVIALQTGDYTKAYNYLAEGEAKPTLSEFRQEFLMRQSEIRSLALQILETNQNQDETIITIGILHSELSPFGSGWRETAGVRLLRQNGEWKIREMPYNLWNMTWYDPDVNTFTP